MGFWTFLAPTRQLGLTWTWQDGVSQSFIEGARGSSTFTGWVGLLTIGVVAGLVTGIGEALGTYCMLRVCASTDDVSDLGGIDDNLSLPIIAGGCLWGLFKVLGWLGGVLA
jgi:diacylglycerol kinase (CTP)